MMCNKMKQRKIILLLIALLLIFPLSVIKVNANYANSIKTNQIYSWKITNISAGLIQYWDSNWQFRGNIKANTGQIVYFAISSIKKDIEGNFAMGNMTTKDNDTSIAYVLILGFGVWTRPWNPGLISSINWTEEKSTANNSINATAGDILIITNNSNKIKFKYQQGNGGNQNTTLVYDMNTGILLECYTEIKISNDYHLGLKFIGVTNITNIGISPWLFMISGVIIVVSVVFIFKKNIIIDQLTKRN